MVRVSSDVTLLIAMSLRLQHKPVLSLGQSKIEAPYGLWPGVHFEAFVHPASAASETEMTIKTVNSSGEDSGLAVWDADVEKVWGVNGGILCRGHFSKHQHHLIRTLYSSLALFVILDPGNANAIRLAIGVSSYTTKRGDKRFICIGSSKSPQQAISRLEQKNSGIMEDKQKVPAVSILPDFRTSIFLPVLRSPI